MNSFRICVAVASLAASLIVAGSAELSASDGGSHCSAYGPAFQAVPGTRSCVRVGGRVRAEAQVETSRKRSVERGHVSADGRVYLDARTATEQGPLRTFIEMGTGVSRGSR